jgi:ATP synthase protein I
MFDPLNKLDADITRLKLAKNPPQKPTQAGLALRVGTELASGVAVGFAIGYGLDAWLKSSPWMTLLWSILGFAAGMRLMLQTARQAEAALEAEEKTSTGEP